MPGSVGRRRVARKGVRKVIRRRPIGAEIRPGGVHIRVWSPDHERVEVVVEGGKAHRLMPDGDSYFAGLIPHAGPGTLYRFRLDGDDALWPDPASRFQPEGPSGPSMVVDPDDFAWSDAGWAGVLLAGHVLYEMHVGTFTRDGTLKAAARELPALANLGVTLVELMPIAEMPGRFGWGYDGVGQFAPYHRYGGPDDLRRFVDRAHGLGLGVILDVVYNHFGPQDNALPGFARAYQTDRDQTEWGQALNFDGPESGPVREFFLENAAYWVEEYHLDGLRIDATQEFHDASDDHILDALTRRVKAAAAGQGRSALVIGENEPQEAFLARPVERGGRGLDALWNDDFHHVARVAATGRREAYYGDYHGSAQEFVSLLRRGWLYQGQFNPRQGKRRGSPAPDLEPRQFINFLQNHDQVANSLRGDRLHRQTDPATFRALTAVLLLAPGTPMLFQGQEFAASSPFTYFTDMEPDRADEMHRGRQDFLSQFPSLATSEARSQLPHPSDERQFSRCKLDHTERARQGHEEAYVLHRDLLRLRRGERAFAAQGAPGVDGAVLGPRAFVARFPGPDGADEEDRLLVVNLGDELHYAPVSEPLLAPPEGRDWSVIWSSESIRYGGSGTAEPVGEGEWRLPAHSAIVLAPGTSTAAGDEL